jgi:hypothetical protein
MVIVPPPINVGVAAEGLTPITEILAKLGIPLELGT